ncbi:MAG: hypothetical protein AB7U38_00810 [Hyphomicrobiales bacterium]
MSIYCPRCGMQLHDFRYTACPTCAAPLGEAGPMAHGDESVHLTTRDHAVLQSLSERYAGLDCVAEAIRRKLDTAHVLLPEDIGAHRVTIGSRLYVTVDGQRPVECVLALSSSGYPLGLALDLGTPRGIALLGRAAGDRLPVRLPEDAVEYVTIEKVAYQPEAARRLEARWMGQLVGFPRWHTPPPVPRSPDDDPGPRTA